MDRFSRRPPEPQGDLPSPAKPELYFLNPEQFQKMLESGVFPPYERVQLINGKLHQKPEVGARESFIIKYVADALTGFLPNGYHLRTRLPITHRYGRLEPDLAVVRGTPFDYRLRHPSLEEVSLIAEVASENSLSHYLKAEATSLANGSVQAYWVLDVDNDAVWVHTDLEHPIPGPSEFKQVRRHLSDEKIEMRLDGWILTELTPRQLLPR